jgi:hypothetical protein
MSEFEHLAPHKEIKSADIMLRLCHAPARSSIATPTPTALKPEETGGAEAFDLLRPGIQVTTVREWSLEKLQIITYEGCW